MKKNTISEVRVRYGETDQMGVVHHGKYASYLEVARIEWMENFGISYKSLEQEGVMLPVYEMNIKYLSPAYFDDHLKIETELVELPSVRITFRYRIKNQEGRLLSEAQTILVFMDAKTRRPIRCPKKVLYALSQN